MKKETFKVIAHEPGFHAPALPTWGDNLTKEDVFNTSFDTSKVKRVEVPEVPGAFQLLNVLTDEETQKYRKFLQEELKKIDAKDVEKKGKEIKID